MSQISISFKPQNYINDVVGLQKYLITHQSCFQMPAVELLSAPDNDLSFYAIGILLSQVQNGLDRSL